VAVEQEQVGQELILQSIGCEWTFSIDSPLFCLPAINCDHNGIYQHGRQVVPMTDQQQKPWWQTAKLTADLETNVRWLNEILGVNESFDMICRRTEYGGKACAFYFVDGFAKDDILNRIMEQLARLSPRELRADAIEKLVNTEIAYIEVETTNELEKAVNAVLSGPTVLLVEGEATAIIIDARTYPARGPEEPDIERVVRGARDGFVETIIFNTALTRRHLRDPSLRMEYMQVGTRSRTDVCIAYVKDIVDPEVVEEVRRAIGKVKTDSLPMAEKSLEEYLFKRYWNPYPMVRYTERPDVAAVHLLEGHVLIYVDTSPSVMITPVTLFHHVQHAEEYRQQPVVGAFLRWTRLLALLASLFLLPLWYLIATQPELFPAELAVIGPDKKAAIPLFLQILIADIGVEVLRMASIHTPSPLATAMGLVAGILLGETAVQVGLFTSEVILYVAISAIGTFASPSYELGLANKLSRLFFLTMTALFGWVGFVGSMLFWFVWLMRIEVLQTPYLWPLIPFNGKALWDVLVRTPMPNKTKRPRVLSPQDPDRK
jgi:stage V sporulation protein AF